MEDTFENNKVEPKGSVSLFSNSLKFGLLTGGAYILVSLLFYSLDIEQTSWLQYLTFLVLIGGIVIGIIQFRDKRSGGYLSYGQCLVTGIIISAVVGVSMAIYIYLFFGYFDPGQIEEMAQIAEQKMVDQGYSDADIDSAMEITRKFMTPLFSSLMSLFSMAFWGTIISLIVSIFLKKNDERFDSAINQ